MALKYTKTIINFIKFKTEHWLQTEYDDNVLDYWKLPNGNKIVNLETDDGLVGDIDFKNTLRSYLGAFILSNSKRIMKKFIREVNGFYNNSICYGDTDSFYIEKKFWDVLDKAGLMGDNLCQGKSDYKSGGIFYYLLFGSKTEYCLTIDKLKIVHEH